jgi:hypothetical protein
MLQCLLPERELSTIFEIAKALFESISLENRSIRLLGISLSNLGFFVNIVKQSAIKVSQARGV